MKSSFRKYVFAASALSVLWVAFLIFVFIRFTTLDEVVAREVHTNSQRVSQQVDKIFAWFEKQGSVYVEKANKAFELPPQARNSTYAGVPLNMAVPIELIKELENASATGVSVKFVSNSPQNIKNLPAPEDNTAMMQVAESGDVDAFSYDAEEKKFHYVRPLFAGKSCITCHTNVQEAGLIGAMVITTNPHKYVNHQRVERRTILIACLVGSSLVVFLLYFFLLHLWHKYKAQKENVEYTKAMVKSMSHSVEVILGNISRIVGELGQGSNDPRRAELLRTLQYMTNDLLVTSKSLSSDSESEQYVRKEELIHVDTFFRQCVQIFHPRAEEKGLELSLKVDADVPVHVLGDAFNLRQVVGLMIKNSVLHTEKGSIVVRVRSEMHMPARFSSQDLDNTPLHLIIEVEDTSKGYVILEPTQLLHGMKQHKEGAKFDGRAVIDISSLSELAASLYGSVALVQNGNTGACFKAQAQVKLVEEAQAPITQNMLSVENAPFVQNATPSQNIMAKQDALHAQYQAPVQNPAPVLPTPQQQASVLREGRQVAGMQAGSVHNSSGALPQHMGGASQQQPDVLGVPQTVREQRKSLPAYAEPVALGALSAQQDQQPVSVIIGDSGINKFTQHMLDIFKESSIEAKLMASGDEIFRALDDTQHTFSVVLLRELSDLDIIYTATRIRYLERMGSPSVAVILMAEDIVQADMDVLRFFNVSTVDNFPRDADIAVKVIRLALRTQGDKIFLGGEFFDKTQAEGDPRMLFDAKKAMENSKRDRTLIRSMCSMWVRFYPAQVARLREFIKAGDTQDLLRLLRSIRNSAGTVCLPMLWEEANRIIEKLTNENEVRYEKLLSIYEQTYEFLKKNLDKDV